MYWQEQSKKKHDELEYKVEGLENMLDECSKINEKNRNSLEEYNRLLAELNRLLLNVFYVYDYNSQDEVWGTGFTILYGGKIYFITAGHLVDGKRGYHSSLGFKQNFTNHWYYPKLVCYDHKPGNDFAVFKDNLFNTGFLIEKENTTGYVLGNLTLGQNIIKSEGRESSLGESGSPVINTEGKVMSLRVTTNSDTDIDRVIEKIEATNKE